VDQAPIVGDVIFLRITEGVMKSALYGVLLGVLLVGPSRGDDKDKPEVETPFFPLKEGTTWNYRVIDGSNKEQKFTVKVTGFETKDGNRCAKLETRRDKDLVSTEFITVKKDGIYRCEFAGGKVDPPLLFFKFEDKDPKKAPKPNENWEIKSKVEGKEFTGKAIAGEAKGVKVPAKTFDTVTVTIKDLKVDNQSANIVYYFAPEFGMVKQEIDIGGQKLKVELEKFEEAKK
jgi:hypothetical protein